MTARPDPSLPPERFAGLTADSRQVRPGWLFAALPGTRVDGAGYIPQALRQGASAILCAPGVPEARGLGPDIRVIVDENPRRRLALMAAAHYGAQPASLLLVTGTNGKSSVADFARQLWSLDGHAAASVGTLGVVVSGLEETLPLAGGGLTTPDPVLLHATLAALKTHGVDRAALEASSHGLDMGRLDGVAPVAAALTNISRDHLDYHGDMDAYRAAKLRLFTDLLPSGGVAVVNRAIPEHDAVAAIAARRGQRLLTYALDGAADIGCRYLAARPRGFDAALTLFGRTLEVSLPLAGRFQVENALCALALVVAAGADPARAAPLLARLASVPGRMQPAAASGPGARVFVDYAHTPDALETALTALAGHAPGRLHVLFGCGGDRDRGKRPLMGAAAARLADVCIITDDNPRHESPAAIRAEILAACPGGVEIPGRRAAIQAALAGLGPEDLLLVAGKGHEREQIIGDTRHPFDDLQIIRDMLAADATGDAR